MELSYLVRCWHASYGPCLTLLLVGIPSLPLGDTDSNSGDLTPLRRGLFESDCAESSPLLTVRSLKKTLVLRGDSNSGKSSNCIPNALQVRVLQLPDHPEAFGHYLVTDGASIVPDHHLWITQLAKNEGELTLVTVNCLNSLAEEVIV